MPTSFFMPGDRQPINKWTSWGMTALLAMVFGLLAIQGADLRREVSSDKVLDATRTVHEQFMAMVAPIDRDLRLVAEWGKSGILELRDARRLNARLIPLRESLPLVSGLMLTGTGGREYFMLRDGPAWYIRRSAS